MHNTADLQETVDEIARVLGASATLEDRSFRLLAYNAQHGEIDAVRQESILRRRATGEVRDYFERFGIARARGPVRIPADHDLKARICWPLRHGDVAYGYLWLLDSGWLTDEVLERARPLVDRAAAVLAQEARTRQDAGRGLRSLLSADPEERAGASLDVQGPVTAVAVRESPERVAALWTLPRGVLARAGSPVALLTPAHLAVEVAQTLQSVYGTAAGLGAPRTDPADAWQSWREAQQALRIAEHFTRFAPIARWEDLGVHRLLARLGRADLRELAAEVAALDPEQARTVETYLDLGGHAQKAAAELGVHRQTLYYRLGKAERALNRDLDDGDDRLVVHLGLKAAHLAR
ncbi:helix-turn-helix domain-containing protein [Nonomuraea sp. NBC_01738]|uniref:PucR family transcriptional regulator n=1 Tax=Nonomuraea sp. NBC_01738 TaxID=2976003 RepID=UPI002E0DEB39|nr:helix-turn-helix domain-containing protein [Nonomuraea sp. NBC_01738]